MNGKSNKSMRRGRKSNRSIGDQQGAPTARVVSIPTLTCPDRVRVRLKYTDQILEAAGSAIKTDYVYRLNSVFDPDFTGTGTQPVGHDIWSSFFDRYRVWKTKIILRPIVGSGSATWVIVPLRTSTALATAAAILARGGNEYGTLGTVNANGFVGMPPGAIGLGGAYMKVFSMPQLFGMSLPQYAGSNDSAAAISSSPADVVFLHINGYSDQGLTTTTWSFMIDMEFEVEYFDRVPLSFSLEERFARVNLALGKRIREKKIREIDTTGLEQPVLRRTDPALPLEPLRSTSSRVSSAQNSDGEGQRLAYLLANGLPSSVQSGSSL